MFASVESLPCNHCLFQVRTANTKALKEQWRKILPTVLLRYRPVKIRKEYELWVRLHGGKVICGCHLDYRDELIRRENL
jgi:hypothetical protein